MVSSVIFRLLESTRDPRGEFKIHQTHHNACSCFDISLSHNLSTHCQQSHNSHLVERFHQNGYSNDSRSPTTVPPIVALWQSPEIHRQGLLFGTDSARISSQSRSRRERGNRFQLQSKSDAHQDLTRGFSFSSTYCSCRKAWRSWRISVFYDEKTRLKQCYVVVID